MIFQIFFWTFTAILLAKALYALIFFQKVSVLLKNTDIRETNADTGFFLVVPLLHEAGVFPSLSDRFLRLISTDSKSHLVFVTTEREYLGRHSKPTTVDLVRDFIQNLPPAFQNRVQHIHYPGINTTLAFQLNFALEKIEKQISKREEIFFFFGFYNADSQTDPEVLQGIRRALVRSPEQKIFQQSSAFFSNHRNFHGPIGALLRSNALRQTRWTFLHEIPRYIKNKTDNISLVHVVTHGLFIRADLLREVGYFPTDGFGEDLYLGFILRGLGYTVQPIPILENSDSPTTLRSMFRQKFVWFWGPLGYVYFWNRFRHRFPTEWQNNRLLIIGTTLLGILDALNWLLAGFAFMLYVLTGIFLGQTSLAIVLGFGYLWSTAAATVHLYHQQKDKELFPRLTRWQGFTAIVLFPIIVFLHGLPAFASIATECSLRLFPREYLRPKTEKR